MATFFGEVLPVTSRAVDDDEDDEQVSAVCEPFIHWSKKTRAELERTKKDKIPCSNLVVALGVEANAFTEIYVKQFSYEIAGGIFTSQQEDYEFTVSHISPTDKTCYIYRCHSNPSILVIQCNRDVLPDESFAWSKLICDHIDISDAYVAILATNTTGTFSSDIPPSDLDTPFLRALKTDKFLGSPVCRVLEQPNMVTGLAAQLMTMLQVSHIRAVLYLVYKDTRHVTIQDVKCFMPVLNVTPIKDITEPAKNADQKLRDIVQLHSHSDTLYM